MTPAREAELVRRVRQLEEQLKSLVVVVTKLRMEEDGTATGEGLSEDDELDVERLGTFGFVGRAPDDAAGVLIKAGGRGDTAFLLGYRDRQYEPALEKGEAALYDAYGSLIRTKQNGDLELSSKTGQKIKLQAGNKGAARLDDSVDGGYIRFVPASSGATLFITPPGGAEVPVSAIEPGTPLDGKIDSASTKVDIG